MKNITQNILIISSRAETCGGGEHYIQSIVKHIDRKRYNPFVAIPREGSMRAALENLNIEVIAFDSYDSWLAPDERWYQALSSVEDSVEILVKFIQRNNIKIIHTNSNVRWEGALAANLAGIHHIYAMRIDFDPYHPLYNRFNLTLPSFSNIMSNLSTFILSVSDSCTKSLSPPIPMDKIRTINNGIDKDFYEAAFNTDQNLIRIELGIPPNAPIIMAAGRIVPDKGFDIYIDSAIKVILDNPTAHFLIAGNSENIPLYETLKNTVSQSIAKDNFHFLGHRTDIEKLLVAADIFVLSSRHEGQSNVLLQAMACQCAVIATRCSGVEDAIVNHDSGIIIDTNDSSAMANAITGLLNNPSALKQRASSARKRINTHFLIQDKVLELMQLYDDVLALPTPPAGSPTVRLFLNTANELAILGHKNIELENRLRRVEHLADLAQNNPLWKALRSLRNLFR